MPDPCAGKAKWMRWPANNHYEPESCDNTQGESRVRDTKGDCVKKVGSCDTPGERRNAMACASHPRKAAGLPLRALPLQTCAEESQ